MKRKLNRLYGNLIMFVSVVVGIVLIVCVFGAGPISDIATINRTMNGAERFWNIVWQVLKMVYGIPYSFAGMILFYRMGMKIKYKKK